MNKRIRNMQELLNAVHTASEQIRILLKTETNEVWQHDHIGLLKSTIELVEEIKSDPLDKSIQKQLGRLVMDNGGIDFPAELQSLLLRISTANLRE